MIPCLSKKLFGIECLGCGTQRSFLMLCKGDFTGAFNLYPPIFTLCIFFIFLVINILDKQKRFTKIVINLAIVNAVVMVLAYSFKMRWIFGIS